MISANLPAPPPDDAAARRNILCPETTSFGSVSPENLKYESLLPFFSMLDAIGGLVAVFDARRWCRGDYLPLPWPKISLG